MKAGVCGEGQAGDQDPDMGSETHEGLGAQPRGMLRRGAWSPWGGAPAPLFQLLSHMPPGTLAPSPSEQASAGSREVTPNGDRPRNDWGSPTPANTHVPLWG